MYTQSLTLFAECDMAIVAHKETHKAEEGEEITWTSIRFFNKDGSAAFEVSVHHSGHSVSIVNAMEGETYYEASQRVFLEQAVENGAVLNRQDSDSYSDDQDRDSHSEEGATE